MRFVFEGNGYEYEAFGETASMAMDTLGDKVFNLGNSGDLMTATDAHGNKTIFEFHDMGIDIFEDGHSYEA